MFEMEQIGIAKVFLILIFVSAINTQDYFVGLNLDPTLIQQTNIAISTLKHSLYLNFNCNPAQFSILANYQNSPFSSTEIGYQFQPFSGFSGGFKGAKPQITCQRTSQRSALLYTIYQQVVTVTTLLQTIKSYLIEYNNIVLGDNNTVVGSNNFVIGSNNSLVGNNDWVFASDYTSTDPQNGVLIIQVFLIELASIPQIAINPTQVIHCVDQSESNRQFNNFWKQTPDNRRFSLR